MKKAMQVLAQVYSVGLSRANLCQMCQAQVGKRSMALRQTCDSRGFVYFINYAFYFFSSARYCCQHSQKFVFKVIQNELIFYF
jgi:hypothetical protein